PSGTCTSPGRKPSGEASDDAPNPNQYRSRQHEIKAGMGGGLAPLEGDDPSPVHYRQAAVRPSLATARWTALDLQTLRRVRSSRTIMTSGRADQKSGWSLDE